MRDKKNIKKDKKGIFTKLKNVFKRSTKETNNRPMVISFVLGLAIGLIVMACFIPERIAKLSNGEEVIVSINENSITANDLYKDMKEEYSMDLLLNKVDNVILTSLYPENNDMKVEVNKMADYYISMYESYYGYTEEKFLEANNFKNKEDFLKTLTLEYRRNEYYNEYLKKQITDNEIEKYYNENIFGDIETKYILVDSTKENSKELAEKIINRLKNNEKYEDIIKHYGDRITSKDLGFVTYENDLSDAFITELIKLNDGEYTKTALEENNKYYIIFRISSKDKKSLEEVKDDIINKVVENKKKENDKSYFQALIELRKSNNVKFGDTDLAKKYEEYIKQYEN